MIQKRTEELGWRELCQPQPDPDVTACTGDSRRGEKIRGGERDTDRLGNGRQDQQGTPQEPLDERGLRMDVRNGENVIGWCIETGLLAE